MQSSYNILQDTRNRLKKLPEGITIKWRRVEGHQKEKVYENIDFWAAMNAKADNLAKSFLKNIYVANVNTRLYNSGINIFL